MYNACSWWVADVVSRNELILDKHKYGGGWKGQKMGIVMVAAKQRTKMMCDRELTVVVTSTGTDNKHYPVNALSMNSYWVWL